MSGKAIRPPRHLSFRVFEIWVEDYKQRLIEKKAMQESQSNEGRHLHTKIMQKTFQQRDDERLERALRDVTVIKLAMAAILGTIVGALIYIIFFL